MKLINASKVYDGQGAFLNGLHDGIRLPRETRLYRRGFRGAWINHAVWLLGRTLARVPGVAKLVRT